MEPGASVARASQPASWQLALSAPPKVLPAFCSKPGTHQPIICPVLNLTVALRTHGLHMLLKVPVGWVHAHEATRPCKACSKQTGQQRRSSGNAQRQPRGNTSISHMFLHQVTQVEQGPAAGPWQSCCGTVYQHSQVWLAHMKHGHMKHGPLFKILAYQLLKAHCSTHPGALP